MNHQANDLFGGTDHVLLDKFRDFHCLNPQVYEKFKEKAIEIKARGFHKYSAWTIIQVIRWEEDLKTRDDVFQINNDFVALYARLLIFHRPDFIDFFELRCMKSKRKPSAEEKHRMEQAG